jgi:hypothetical protein
MRSDGACQTNSTTIFLAPQSFFQPGLIGTKIDVVTTPIGLQFPCIWDRRRDLVRMVKCKNNKNKAKLNLAVHDEQRSKLEQMAS